MEIEKRAAPEVRADGRSLVGYAAIFNAETQIADFLEVVRPGAFSVSLASGADILALVDHDRGRVLARTKSGSLVLHEDARGLAFKIDVPDTTAGRDVLALGLRGDLGGMSFAFSVTSSGERWIGNRRELRAVTLHEVSVISGFPAYLDTVVAVRHRAERSSAARRIARLELEANL